MKSILKNILIIGIAITMFFAMAACDVSEMGGDGTTGMILPGNDMGEPAGSDINNSDTTAAVQGWDDATEPDQTTIESTTADTTKTAETTNAPAISGDPDIEETVCFEYNGLRVVAKKLTEDAIFGRGVKLYIENGSDSDLAVSVNQLIVNDCMISDAFSSTVAAGKKANETLYFSDSDLENAEIDTIGTIEIYFYVYDPNSYQTLYEAECVTIKTSAHDSVPAVRAASSGTTMYENDGIKIVGKYVRDTWLGKSFVLYIENNSGRDVAFSCDDMSVNGFMVDAFFSETVYNGKYAVSDISIYESDLEKNDIGVIEEFELKFHTYDPRTYNTIASTGALTFKVK